MFGFIFYLIIIAVVIYNVFYRKCPLDSAMVIIDRSNPSSRKIKKILVSGGEFVNPFTCDFKILSFGKTRIGINQKNILAKDNSRINIDITFIVAFSKKSSLLRKAALEIIHLSQFEILNKARVSIADKLKLLCLTYNAEEINDNSNFRNELEKSISVELKEIGMEVINIYINSVTDNSGKIKPQKQPKQVKKEKAVQNPSKASFLQEFDEIVQKEVEKAKEESALTEIIKKPFNNESFEDFKVLTKQFSSLVLNNELEEKQEQEEEQEEEQIIKQELTEVLKKAAEKSAEKMQESYTEPSAELTYNEQPSSETATTEQIYKEPTPNDDIFASVRHYFENKNQ